ncbi:hypothetical protein [Archangium sp.]|uniref:hypothetical protein n=1 Tax=Archangium sp. TaxID=1872627 RepID=UPI002D38F4FA|nr:hypothetical protein [Archangium sp.]HYO57898.1 hypothetical protein [Archangium sp.]
MSTDKQSEVNGAEPERLGPYQLEEQVPQSPHAPGELYLATHDTSGATALVLKPADEKGSEALTDLRVHYVSSASPSYVALEVEHSPWSRASEKHSVEARVCMFEDVREGVRRMARALHESNAPHRWWRLGLALAGAAAVCALTFALARPFPES